jgi:RNA polymerase sigma-70 factor (ECF subfamily)
MPETHRLRPEELLTHLEWLRRLARVLVKPGEDADDLAQESMRVALTTPPVADRSVRPWLAAVMRNLSMLGARRQGRRARRETAAVENSAVPSSPEELVERVQTERLLGAIVLRLEEPFRSTVLLRYYEGRSSADIARVQGVPAGTVRWRLKTGLDRIRDELDREHGGDHQRWLVVLAPVAAAAPPRLATPLTTTVTKGVVLLSTKLKIACALVLMFLLILAVRRASIWPGSADQTARARSSVVAPSMASRLTPGRGGFTVTAASATEPEGALRLQGRVVDAAEAPIPGAVVAVDARPPRVATSDANGEFFFSALRPRTYRLEASAGELYAGPVATQLAPGSAPVVLRARAGTTLIVEVRAGRGGAPVPGARVELRSMLVWRADTDDNGEAALAGLGPGWHPLRVEAAGFAPAAQMVTIDAGGASQRVSILLESGVAVDGRVLDPEGAPVANARVWARSTSEPFPVVDPMLDAITTDHSGRWRVPALAAGTYQFVAEHPDFAQTATGPVIVGTTPPSTPIELRLEGGGLLTGQVRDDDGNPVGGANVRAAALGGVNWLDVREGWADDAGHFRLSGLPRRTLQVIATHEQGASAMTPADLAATREASLALTIGVHGTIEGIVVDGRGQPVPEAQVIAQPLNAGRTNQPGVWELRGVPTMASDSDGRFRFRGLPEGAYALRGARPEDAPDTIAQQAETAARPGDRDVRVVLSGGALVRGLVRFEDGSTPKAFGVRVGRGRPRSFATTDGTFSLSAVAGTHDLVLTGAFVTETVHGVRIEEAKPKDVGTITVSRGRSLRGLVVDDSGAPVAHAEVAGGLLISGSGTRLNVASEGRGVQETKTGEDGRFVLSGFDESPLMVVAGAEGKGRSKSLSVPRGRSDAELELRLEATGSLEGTLTRNGRPFPDTVVVASPRGTRSNFFVVSGPDGRYALDTLVAGPYVLMALVGQFKDAHFNATTIEAGRRGHADLDVVTGPLTVTLRIATDEGKPVPIAQVVLGSGQLPEASNMDELRARWQPSGPAVSYTRQARGPTVLEGLAPGVYTACVVPIPADATKPEQLRKAMAGAALLPMRCERRELDRSGDLPLAVPKAWADTTE